MFSVTLEHFLPGIVDGVRLQNGEALYFDFQVSVSSEENIRAVRWLSFLFVRERNRTYVFFSQRLDYCEAPTWVFMSAHDPCWKTDGLRSLFEIYIEMCRSVDQDRPPASLKHQVSLITMKRVAAPSMQKDPSCTLNYKVLLVDPHTRFKN